LSLSATDFLLLKIPAFGNLGNSFILFTVPEGVSLKLILGIRSPKLMSKLLSLISEGSMQKELRLLTG